MKNTYCLKCKSEEEFDYPSNVIGPPAYDYYWETETHDFRACCRCETVHKFTYTGTDDETPVVTIAEKEH